jgi:hypothetical protein
MTVDDLQELLIGRAALTRWEPKEPDANGLVWWRIATIESAPL